MEQLNKIVESCEYASDAYWGDPEKYVFRAFIDNFGIRTEIPNNSDRLVAAEFSIRLRGYLIPNTIQNELNSVKTYNSKASVIVSEKVVQNIDDL